MAAAIGALALSVALGGCGQQQGQQAQQANAPAGAAAQELPPGQSSPPGGAATAQDSAGSADGAENGTGIGAGEGAGTGAGEKLKVYASFYPMYDFAARIGGNMADVSNMVPPGTEPHDWEPAAADMAGLESADIFIYNGAGLEHWAGDILGALQNESLIAVEASAGIALMEGHSDDEHGNERVGEEDADGDVGGHGDDEGFDPHVWLSPKNAKVQLLNIKNAFVLADPGNADLYEANYSAAAAEMDALDREYAGAISALPDKDIIVSHQAFGYLCSEYGLNQVPIEGLSPDSEPDPARMAEIIEFANEHGVRVIFFEELVSPKVAETIAGAIGAQTDVLSPIEGLSDEEIAAGDDYFSVMRQNLKAIERALS
ncbi:MAG: metal ABC transporter substrate-binding protein [Clostridiales bacterium]|jgi:zinc transport system substrate-binding protein|nr:metal ABC transporter substrate-binding protein [Clostridiales bacterium]